MDVAAIQTLERGKGEERSKTKGEKEVEEGWIAEQERRRRLYTHWLY